MKKSVRIFYTVLFTAAVALPVLFFGIFGKHFDTSDSENRQLAAMPSFSFATASQYPDAFEAYFSDHLPFRRVSPCRPGREPPADIVHCRICTGRRRAGGT